MRENGGMKTARRYEWDGKEVSRSTFFRMKRRTKRRARVESRVDAQRVQIAARVVAKPSRQSYVYGANELLDREHVGTFMVVADNLTPDPNDCVVVKMPRKVLTAITSVLRDAGY